MKFPRGSQDISWEAGAGRSYPPGAIFFSFTPLAKRFFGSYSGRDGEMEMKMENFLMMLLSGELSNRLNTNCSPSPRSFPYPYAYPYIPTHSYILIYFMNSLSHLPALPVGKLWKWNARHVPRKSLRLRPGKICWGQGVVGWGRPIVNEPKSCPSHAQVMYIQRNMCWSLEANEMDKGLQLRSIGYWIFHISWVWTLCKFPS